METRIYMCTMGSSKGIVIGNLQPSEVVEIPRALPDLRTISVDTPRLRGGGTHRALRIGSKAQVVSNGGCAGR